MQKETLDGIILVLSCQKHMNGRLIEFKLPKKYYNNYKVIYVVGDLFLQNNYELRNDDFLWLKTEDSYLHLLKKLTLAIKYLYELYDIKEGILRCGDDLEFDENRLIDFLRKKKYDFYGQSATGEDFYSEDLSFLKLSTYDHFMYSYYENHPDDFLNPLHNLGSLNCELLSNFAVHPDITGPAGVIYYLSNKSCKILVDHMEKINYNVLCYDDFSDSYPYTIEDVGVTFIMYLNKIKFTNYNNFFDTDASICTHTNKYKYQAGTRIFFYTRYPC